MTPALPANPLSIGLTITHRRLWWHIADEDEQPELWDVSADIWRLGSCPNSARHVADIHLAVADLSGQQNLLDSVGLDEWALEFIAETVTEPTGRLHHDLERRISPGPPRLVVLRQLLVSEPWRGHGLGPVLVASALRIMAPNARLAACRLSPADFHCPGQDRMCAELASLHAGAMLERIGFELWRDVHIIDLRNQCLMDAGIDLMSQWWPHRYQSDQK